MEYLTSRLYVLSTHTEKVQVTRGIFHGMPLKIFV